ncbi:MAG: ACP S-malonyltransferase [Gammaproteobacteria bacterium]
MSLAFVFPGQGSQALGMADQLLADYPDARHRFDQASEILGYDIADLIANGPVEKLNRTEVTQPALLVVSVAVWEQWVAAGGARPKFMAGHSFGEYSALVCSEAMSFEDGIAIVQYRGRFMQEAAPEDGGAVAAILGLEREALITICEQSAEDEIVQCANFNAPGQIAIAGHSAAVARAGAAALEAGAKKVIPLKVSAPVHTEIMRAAADRLAEKLTDMNIKAPNTAVLHNVDVKARNDSGDIRQALYDQMFSPVQWAGTVSHLGENGVDTVVECGPGKVLSGLVKRTNRKLNTIQICDKKSIDDAIVQCGA